MKKFEFLCVLIVVLFIGMTGNPIFAAEIQSNGPQVQNQPDDKAVTGDNQLIEKLIEQLAKGPLPVAMQNQLLLLSQEVREYLRQLLLKQMTSQQINNRADLFAIVGPDAGDLVDAEETNQIGRRIAGSRFQQDIHTRSWQLYVDVPFYSQKDPAWSGKGLGFAYCQPGDTIGAYGCHLCCVAMLYAKWGYSGMKPPILNDWTVGSRAHYAFSTSACGDLIRTTEALQYPSICRPWRYITGSEIYSRLQRGQPVVVRVDLGKGNHYMVIFAFDGQKYWVKDPLKDSSSQSQPLYGSNQVYMLYGYQ